MELQKTTHYNFETPTSALNSTYSNDFDEIPTFEEAFDPASLRKFFHEHESTNSQSAYSPHKDNFVIEETRSQGPDENDPLLSPNTQNLSRLRSNTYSQASNMSFPFTFNLSSKILNPQEHFQDPSWKNNDIAKPSRQVEPISEDGKKIISNKKEGHHHHTRSSQQANKSKKVQNQDKKPHTKIDTGKEDTLEKLIKQKMVFTINRNTNGKEGNLILKRNSSTVRNEELLPTKKIKREFSLQQVSAGSNTVLNLNPLHAADVPLYPFFPNHLADLHDIKQRDSSTQYSSKQTENDWTEATNRFFSNI